ncbi:MAG: peptide chain release factor N(5)-glutamine methyltransferase [Bacilli bacterium]|jgi:release factor glutamine methyltransferase|nr:peptide chain release factor N(5)-glutamine methyltransferase [Bacilli bacterium]
MVIRDLLNESILKINEAHKEERAAYELLKKHLKIENYQLYLMLEEEVDKAVIDDYNQDLNDYLDNKPLQYILGYEMFLGRDFIVNDKVLIPRYETEELVENILYHIDDYFSDYEQIDIVDIGCGSGAIAISLDLEDNKTKVIGSDISSDALSVATHNNELLKAEVTFKQGDMLQPLIDNNIKVDILVSNPPYIPDEELLENSVKDYEPHVALFGGNQGLDFYEIILKNAHLVIKERALLAFEIGYNQKDGLINLINKYFKDASYQILKDINGKDRMLFIYHNLINK